MIQLVESLVNTTHPRSTLENKDKRANTFISCAVGVCCVVVCHKSAYRHHHHHLLHE